MSMAEVVAVLRANTSEFTAKMDEAEAKVARLSKSGAGNMEKLASVGKAALLGLGTVAVGVGVVAVDMADKQENAQAQMNNAFKNAGTTTGAYKNQIANLDGQMTTFGYTNAQTNSALAQLVTVTGNAQSSISNMGLAANIAANRHMDLNSAATLMAKTMAGNVTAAKRMGIEIPANILKIKDPTEKANAILGILGDRFKGSASAAAGTFAGKTAAVKAQMENWAASIGQKLIPILQTLVGDIQTAISWLSHHKEVMIGIAVAVAGALGTLAVMWVINTIAAMAFWTAATGGIIILVAALAVGIAWIVTHWGEVWTFIKDVAADAWHWIYNNFIQPVVQAFSDVIDWVKGHWPLLLAIITGPFGLAIYFIMSNWNSIVNFFSGLVASIGSVFTQIGNAIWNGIKSGINLAIGGINTLISAFDSATGWIPGVPNIPQIPKMRATGGPVIAGQPYIVGERGPELFTPGASGNITPNNQLGAALGSGGGTTVNVYATTNADPNQIATAMAWALRTASAA